MAYAHRDLLKAALSIPASATDKHALLDAALDGVTKEIDQYVGAAFGPSSGTRYFKPTEALRLDLDYPLLAVDSLTLDTDGNGSYESTIDSTGYWTLPDNATAESPRAPFWGFEIRADAAASAAFPVGVRRGAKVVGTWGWFDERTEVTFKPATGIDATATVWDVSNATAVHPGQVVRVDSEQVLVTRCAQSGSDVSCATGQVTVVRARGGTVGATHSSNSTASVYTYPVVERATLFQAEMDYRGGDAPLGTAAGDFAGGQPLRAAGGLHPFTRRQLDQFRTPVAR